MEWTKKRCVLVAVVCYFDTPTPLCAVPRSLYLSSNLHMSSYGIIWHVFFFFFFFSSASNVTISYLVLCHLVALHLYHWFVHHLFQKKGVRVVWLERHHTFWRWTMFIGKPRVLTSNTHTQAHKHQRFWICVRNVWGQERWVVSLRTASKLSKIKSTVGQVLNPVVLTTFCFHSIIFCFGVVLMEGGNSRSSSSSNRVVLVFGWCSFVRSFVVDELAILVLWTISQTYTLIHTKQHKHTFILSLFRQVQNHLWRSLDRWCVMMCVTELPLCRIWSDILYSRAKYLKGKKINESNE